MKKKFLCLVLCLCIMFGTTIFFACKQDNGYQLSNLLTDYKAIANDCKSVVFSSENNKSQLVFDYSYFKNINNEEYLSNALKLSPYNNLENYNLLFYSSMEFINQNISNISSDAFKVSKGNRNSIKSNLNNLKNCLVKVDIQVQDFARFINSNAGNEPTNDVYKQRFKHLLDSYDDLIDCTFNFTISFAKTYYQINSDYQNIDNSSKLLTDFSNEDKTAFIIGLNNRRNFAISNLSYIFYERNVKNGVMSSKLISSENQGMGEEFNNYKSKLETLTKDFSLVPAEALDNELIYNSSITLYNIWNCLKNDYEKFSTAFNSINYTVAKTNEFNRTKFESYCVKIIEDYFFILNENVDEIINIVSQI